MTGGLVSAACQNEARRLRRAGVNRIEAPAAALKTGTARGWTANPEVAPARSPRDGRVWVLFGLCDAVGWPAVEAGATGGRAAVGTVLPEPPQQAGTCRLQRG
jgi:hypothetical protein